MPKQTPCLWFDGQAEQAATHYTTIFPNSAILGVTATGRTRQARREPS